MTPDDRFAQFLAGLTLEDVRAEQMTNASPIEKRLLAAAEARLQDDER